MSSAPKEQLKYQSFHEKNDYFVIEREPGKGFHVKYFTGPNAEDEERQRAALKLLEELPQPGAARPGEEVWQVEPMGHPDENVIVWVEMGSNGEPRYREFWCKLKPNKVTRSWARAFLAALVGLAFGALLVFFAIRLEWMKMNVPEAQVQGSDATREVASMAAQRNSTERRRKDPREDTLLNALMTALIRSDGEREKIKKYLEQPEFGIKQYLDKTKDQGTVASRTDQNTTKQPLGESQGLEVKRCVKLIADLDTTPPLRKSIRLDSVEVLHLLERLEILENYENYKAQTGDKTNQKPRES